MQAIITKFISATNCRGSRIKASCERGSIIISYPDELSGDAVHIAAADALVSKFVKEDADRYGTVKDDAARYGTNKNPWLTPRVCGGLPDGSVAHVFVS